MGCFGGKGAAFYPGLGFPGAKIESGTNISHICQFGQIYIVYYTRTTFDPGMFNYSHIYNDLV